MVGNFLSTAGRSPGVCEELAMGLSGAGWRVLTTSHRHARWLRLVSMISSVVIRRRDYELAVVDVFSGRSFIWAEAVAWTLKRLKKPFVLNLHGGNLPEFAARRRDRVRRLMAAAQQVVSPSGYLKERLAPYRGDITVIPNPIHRQLYPFRLREHARPNLLWLRAFHDIYNPRMAVRVAALLAPACPDLRLTMVGPDKCDGSLARARTEARLAGLTDRVIFLGPVSKREVPAILAEADFFVNTANVDNTPVSVIEAMACGLCVVSTHVGGIPFLVRHEVEALLVEPNDATAMAAAVRRCLDDPALCLGLSQAARAATEGFAAERVLDLWGALFDRMLCPCPCL